MEFLNLKPITSMHSHRQRDNIRNSMRANFSGIANSNRQNEFFNARNSFDNRNKFKQLVSKSQLSTPYRHSRNEAKEILQNYSGNVYSDSSRLFIHQKNYSDFSPNFGVKKTMHSPYSEDMNDAISNKVMLDRLRQKIKNRKEDFKRENIALLARLEIAKENNKKIRKVHQSRLGNFSLQLQNNHNCIDLKMKQLRIRDFKKHNAPPKVTLPPQQLPNSKFYKYSLNGEKDLARFFKRFNEDREYEKKKEESKEEKRFFSKIFNSNARNQAEKG
jgi:hypothetical protein